MTNKEWRRSRDPMAMLQGVLQVASERKNILYMCAGCRSIWDLLYDQSSREYVEVAERWADGMANESERDFAGSGAEVPTFGHDFQPIVWREWHPDGSIPESVQRLIEMGVLAEHELEQNEIAIDTDLKAAVRAAAELAYFVMGSTVAPYLLNYISNVDWPGEWLLRCVFGKPFLPPVPIDPAWQTPNVLSLSQGMYESRDFGAMPILGDALEEAGCDTPDILNHCRAETPHVRGCWVVDRLLGKS